MILQSLAKAMREQNYYAVLLEFVIVIAGVVIGFQVNAWNETRIERNAEEKYLRSLAADVAHSRLALEEERLQLLDQQKALQQLYIANRTGESPADPEELDRLFAAGLFYLASLDVNQTTFDALVSSGNLNILADDGLVSALQRLNADLDAARVALDNEYQATYRFSDPLLLAGSDLSGMFGLPRYEDSVPWARSVEQGSISLDDLSGPRFGNILLYRGFFSGSVLARVDGLIESLSEIDDRIKARLAEGSG